MNVFKERVEIPDNVLPARLFDVTVNIVIWCITVLLWLPASVACLPLFLLGLCIWGLPPIISPWSRLSRYFIAVFIEGRPEDNIPFSNRVIVFLILFTSLIKAPINGTLWFLDELFYPAYHNVNIKEPVFFISAARSGSTQLAYYLENDENNFICPTSGEGLYPFIWFWRFIVPVLKRFVKNKQHVAGNKLFAIGSEVQKRHDFDLTKTDTWEAIYGVWVYTYLSWYLGTDFMKWGFILGPLEEPTDQQYLKSFYEFLDSTMKKVVYHRGQPLQHMLVKGHFLISANGLQQRFPDAKFFTVVREPLDRLQSCINFLMVLSANGRPRSQYLLSTVSWKVVCDWVIHTQIPYCEQEMLFYDQSKDNKLAIPFTMYVNKLSHILQTVYSFCNIQIPTSVMSNAVIAQKTTHDRTNRKASYNPKFNRSLASLGINEEKLKEHLTRYTQWMERLDKMT